MKEASGELSMTAIAVVAIAAIGVVFTTLIWPGIRANITRSTNCAQAFNCRDCNAGMCTCDYLDANGNPATTQCPDSAATGNRGR
jgi:hypothetical protein